MDDIKDNHFTQSELEELTDLYNAMLTMEDSSEMHKFFVDLCSINELHSLLHRWQIVRRIEQGKSYEEINRKENNRQSTWQGQIINKGQFHDYFESQEVPGQSGRRIQNST